MAQAAGLGRLSVQSALGQPLRAEVEITAVGRDEAGALGARLATPEAFRQAGLEFNAALSSLRFAVDRRADGRPVVRITSTQALNEPFVDLLLELTWPTGRFVREYTFLLDPPELRVAREPVEGGMSIATPVLPAAGVVSSVPAPTPATPAPAPAQAAPAPAPAAQAPAAQAPAAEAPSARSTAPAPAGAPPVARKVTEKPVPATRTDASGAAVSRVQVQNGETLATIANRVRPEGVSLDQAMLSLYQANPEAFFGSVHQLRAGSVLNVPEATDMSRTSSARARAEIQAQTADFPAYRSRLADAAPTVRTETSGRTATGSVSARVEDKAAAPLADQLKLSRSGGTTGAPGASGNATSREAEQATARDAARREAESRIAALERNVNDLEKLLELKSRALADLQKQVDEARQSAKGSSGTVARAEVPAATPAASAVSADATPAASPAPSDGNAGTPAPAAESPVAAAPAAAPAPSQTARPSAAPVPPSFVEDLLDNPFALPGLGAVLALSGAYAWYALRRRRRVEKFEDSLIAAEGVTSHSLFGTTGGEQVDTSQSTFATSTNLSGIDTHATEVDPIAEAEVYIAYGRDAQAEEILREALRRQPERQAVRAKLLDILASRIDVAGFAQVAHEMHDMTGGLNEEWARVQSLGQGIDPTNPLYAGAAADVGEVPAASFDAPISALAPSEALSELRFDADDDFSLDAPKAAAPISEAEETGVSFEDTQSLEAAAGSPTEMLVRELDSLDFSLDDLDAKSPAPPAVAKAAPASLEEAIDGRFELPSLDLSLDSEDGVALASPATASAVLPAREDLSLDFADLAAAPAPAEEPASGEPALDSVRWQEIATKLDLASAYEEIGDREGARELLEEVLRGGDTEQRTRARESLARIG